MNKANAEGWKQLRSNVESKALAAAEQRTAEAAASNAATAQRIKAKLLARLEKEIDALPDYIGSEMHQDVANITYDRDKNGKTIGRMTKRTDGGKRYKLTDLTRAYKDLVDDSSSDIEAEQVKVIIDV